MAGASGPGVGTTHSSDFRQSLQAAANNVSGRSESVTALTDPANTIEQTTSAIQALLGISPNGVQVERASDAKAAPAVFQSFPDDEKLSFAEVLQQCGPEELDRLKESLRRLRSATALAATPVVAVTGMLNAGKTSLVASMLSPEGEARALRGESNVEGTHRFVLWLPRRWRQEPETFGLLQSQLAEAFGEPCEELSPDPAEAHRQYNNAADDPNKLGIPLIATDPRLDELRVGLLDCPDIVTAAALGKGDATIRREMLAAAAPLCSAFIVVSAMHSARDQTLEQILQLAGDLMPGVPRYLAINLIRPKYTPADVQRDLHPLVERHGVASLYLAYDFDLRASRERIPRAHQQETALRYPVFFVPSDDDRENTAETISDDRLLSSLPSQLDRPALYDRFSRALSVGSSAEMHAAKLKIDQQIRVFNQRAESGRTLLLQTALELFAVRGADGSVQELRLHQSEQIVRQLNEAFIKAAPWYARLGMRFQGSLHRIGTTAQDAVRRLLPSEAAVAKAEEVKRELVQGRKGSVLTPTALAAMLRRTGAIEAIGAADEKANLESKAEEILARFERDDVTRLDSAKLETAARQMWREVSVGRKLQAGLTPLAAVVAVFGGVMMVPLDFGGTAVVAAASIKELLAAAGLAAFATWWSGQQAHQSVTESAAMHQLANLVAIMCDSFGLPRETSEQKTLTMTLQGRSRQLPAAEVAARPQAPVHVKLWQWNNDFLKRFDQHVERLRKA